jgi:hypothetical protein
MNRVRHGPVPPPEQFEEFQAQELFCGRCRTAQPVRERLLLVLPDGELREYVCAACGTSVGQRRMTAERPALITR